MTRPVLADSSLSAPDHGDASHASRPFPFHNQQAQVDRDPQALAERLEQHCPIKDLAPRLGYEKCFLHRTSTIQAGSLLLSVGYSTPIAGEIGEMKGVAAIDLCMGGMIRYENQQRSLEITENQPLYFSPETGYRYSAHHFLGLVVHPNLERLRTTAAAIAGIGVSERRFASELDHALVLSTDSPRNRILLRSLRRILALLDDPNLERQGYLDVLQIDDLLCRQFALLLCPKLDSIVGDGLQASNSSRERVFEDLLEWLRARLREPVSLSELELRTGYSRRTLQLAFQQRFGCGPMQWVRRQRLEQARLALLSPLPGCTVGAVASRFGFSSLPVFSRDFQRYYGMRPSELLREGRRKHS